MKDYLVNNNLYSENVMDYENQDLNFKFVSDAVGIVSKQENNKRLYIVYLTDEFGGIEHTKDCNFFNEALNYARRLYESLRSYSYGMGAGVFVDTGVDYPETYTKTKR